ERDQRLDAPQEVEGGPACGAVDGVGVAVADVQRWWVEGEGAERPVAAEREPDLAGQLDGLLVDPQQQPLGEQSGDRPARVRRAAASDGRARGEGVEHAALV